MFSAPTAIRVLKKHDPALLKKYDLSSLKHLFLAGEPLDEPTHAWIAEGLGKPVIDHYWQTETGWPVLSAMPGVEKTPIKFGSPSFPVYGYDLKLLREVGRERGGRGREGGGGDRAAAAAGLHDHHLGRRRALREDLFLDLPKKLVYTTFDWGIRDKDGYYFILGRTDDVINVAGHRLGTREIEEAVNMHPDIAECAVVGVADQLKGQMPMAFAVVKDSGEHRHGRSAHEARRRGDGDGGQAARRHRAAEGGVLRHAAAQDALGQDAAPLDPGAGRGARSGRPHHDRGSGRARADPDWRCNEDATGTDARGLREDRRRGAGRGAAQQLDRGHRDPRRRRPPAALRAHGRRHAGQRRDRVEKGAHRGRCRAARAACGRSAIKDGPHRRC